jgi:hypothetical protein
MALPIRNRQIPFLAEAHPMKQFARLLPLLGCKATLILGLVAAWAVDAGAVDAAPVRLPATIEGKVVDRQDVPVAGARVTARIDPIHSYPDPADPATPKPWTAATDDQGRYTFSTEGQALGPDDMLGIEIRADGFVDLSAAYDGPQAAKGSLPVQRLAVGRKIQGRLVDPDGNPVTEAALRFIANAPGLTMMYTSAPQPVDKLGAFSVWIPKTGKAALAIYPRGFAPQLVDVPPRTVDTTEIGTDLGPIRLERGVSLKGRVVDRQGHGVAGTVVAIGGTESRELYMFMILIGTAVKTDEEGRFTLPPVRGSYRVWVCGSAPDYSRQFVVTGSKPPPILPRKIDFDFIDSTQEFIFRESKSVTVRGTVRWPDGTGVPDIEVKSFMLPAGWEMGTDLSSARTDAQGHYVLRLPVPVKGACIHIPSGIAAPDGSFRQFKAVGAHARDPWGPINFELLIQDMQDADFEVGPKP